MVKERAFHTGDLKRKNVERQGSNRDHLLEEFLGWVTGAKIKQIFTIPNMLC